MSVFKHHRTGRWVAQIHDTATGRSRQVGTYPTRREAAAAERAAYLRREDDQAAGVTPTVAQWQDRWLAAARGRKPSTLLHYRERTSAFVAEHGHVLLERLDPAAVRDWCERRPADRPVLGTMLNAAVRDGKLAANPLAGAPIERGRGRRDLPSGWLTLAAVDELAEAAVRVHGDYGRVVAAMLVFAAHTGVRPGELFAVREQDLRGEELEVATAVDSRTREITEPKHGPRVVALPATARRAAEDVPRLAGAEVLFPAPRGQHFWASTWASRWHPVRAAAGRPSMSLHELRHFAATRLLDLGLDAATVAHQLGHNDGGRLVVSTYGHPDHRLTRARILAALDGVDTGQVADLRHRRAASA